MMAMLAWTMEIVKRSDAGQFVILPKRWIVERTFAWLALSNRQTDCFSRN
jgi:transposase